MRVQPQGWGKVTWRIDPIGETHEKQWCECESCHERRRQRRLNHVDRVERRIDRRICLLDIDKGFGKVYAQERANDPDRNYLPNRAVDRFPLLIAKFKSEAKRG